MDLDCVDQVRAFDAAGLEVDDFDAEGCELEALHFREHHHGGFGGVVGRLEGGAAVGANARVVYDKGSVGKWSSVSRSLAADGEDRWHLPFRL